LDAFVVDLAANSTDDASSLVAKDRGRVTQSWKQIRLPDKLLLCVSDAVYVTIGLASKSILLAVQLSGQ